MDAHTLRVLEFDKIKDVLSQHVSCGLGAAHVDALQPSLDPVVVKARLAETTECRTLIDAGDRLPFGGLNDIAELVRLAAAGGILRAEEMVEFAECLGAVRRLKEALFGRTEKYPLLCQASSDISFFNEIEANVRRCIGDRGDVLDQASPALAGIRSAIRSTRSRLTQRAESVLRSPAYRLMIQDAVIVQRSGRTCIPIKTEYRTQFPGLVHDQSSSGQTVFMEPAETLEVSNEMRRLELEEEAEVTRILGDLSSQIGGRAPAIRRSLECAGVLDFIYARASYSRDLDASPPVISGVGEILLKTARHPLLTGDVVPLDIELNSDRRTVVITGPNTGGKTVALKTVGLLALMAQAGLHIPAVAGCRLPIFPAVHADIGDEQSIAQSLSTFSSHLTQIVRVVSQLQKGALVLLDELGAGTDPVEGSALASALLEHFTNMDARTIVTTHYGELKELAYRLPGIENASVQFDEETLRPTFHLQMGVPGRSLALVIASRLGLPDDLVQRAREKIGREERSAWEMLRQIEEDQRESEDALRKAEEYQRDAQRLKETREKELADLERRRRDILAKAAADAHHVVQETRDQVRIILSDLRQRTEKGTSTHHATEALGAMDRELTGVRQQIAGLAVPAVPTSFKPAVGDPVQVVRFGQRGTVTDAPPGGEVTVVVGGMKMKLPLSELRPAQGGAQQPMKKPGHAILMEKAATVPSELKLLGLRPEEAMPELDKYLDDAVLSEAQSVRIIHGKGTGALKRAVWEWLRGHPAVKSYRLGEDGEGGAGATIVEMVGISC